MSEYVTGFGNPSSEFWLGLDKVASLTSGGAKLLIELETFEVAILKLLFIFHNQFLGKDHPGQVLRLQAGGPGVPAPRVRLLRECGQPAED